MESVVNLYSCTDTPNLSRSRSRCSRYQPTNAITFCRFCWSCRYVLQVLNCRCTSCIYDKLYTLELVKSKLCSFCLIIDTLSTTNVHSRISFKRHIFTDKPYFLHNPLLVSNVERIGRNSSYLFITCSNFCFRYHFAADSSRCRCKCTRFNGHCAVTLGSFTGAFSNDTGPHYLYWCFEMTFWVQVDKFVAIFCLKIVFIAKS